MNNVKLYYSLLLYEQCQSNINNEIRRRIQYSITVISTYEHNRIYILFLSYNPRHHHNLYVFYISKF